MPFNDTLICYSVCAVRTCICTLDYYIENKGEIFNLYDTNGRRKDIINAIQIYITILYDLLNNQNYMGQILFTFPF